ncbi:MAG: hypothetical protein DMG65_16260 [Candidatus Angelobacter sp. Gp1-AA117]|nr:MAG: hypothetical protein DMG65_16260 [Candidatus Angelobacter sp. Gp1-AA117]
MVKTYSFRRVILNAAPEFRFLQMFLWRAVKNLKNLCQTIPLQGILTMHSLCSGDAILPDRDSAVE